MKNQHLPDCKLKAISFSLYDIGFSFRKMAKSKRLKFSTLFKRKLKNPAMLLTLLFVRHFVCSWYQYLFYWNGLLRTRIWALTVKKSPKRVLEITKKISHLQFFIISRPIAMKTITDESSPNVFVVYFMNIEFKSLLQRWNYLLYL